MPALALLALLSLGSPVVQSDAAAACASADRCRTLAEAAAAAGDYEAFHTLAWRVVQTSRRNDPDAMFLLARAQSLSGRPHDALIMLRRLADRGVARLDVETDEDFRRARDHAEWPATRARLRNAAGPDAASDALAAAAPDAPAAPAAPVAPDAPAAPDAPDAPAAPAAPAAPVAPDAPAAPDAPDARAAPDAPDLPAPGPLTPRVGRPIAMAYDAVSARLVLADATSNTLKIVSELSGNTVDLVTRGWSGPFATTAIALDARRGDLWVAGAEGSGDRSAVHRLQLISGRLLYSVTPPAEAGPTRFVDIALASARVLLLDAAGNRIFELPPGARSLQPRITLDLAGLTNLADAGENVVYVAHAAGVARVNLAARTSVPLAAAPPVDLTGLEWIARRRSWLLAIQRRADGLVALKLRLDPRGHAALSAEVIGPAASRAATVLDDVFYYLEPSPAGAATLRSVKLP